MRPSFGNGQKQIEVYAPTVLFIRKVTLVFVNSESLKQIDTDKSEGFYTRTWSFASGCTL